jgi:histidinol-phosphate aminotransferase
MNTSSRCLFRALTASLCVSFAVISIPVVNAGEVLTDPEGKIKISSNENVWGFSPKALARVKEALVTGNYYNRDEITEFVNLCAAYNGVKEDMIMPAAGSGPLLTLTALAYAQKGKNVVTTAMGYGQLVGKFAERGGDVKYAPLGESMGYDFKALARTIDENTVVVYICNPNNPTGVLADPRELRNFILSVRDDILVFVDEAYLELADTGLKANTMVPLTKVRKNLLVTRTFSKGHGMAGLRFGYGIGHPAVLDRLEEYSSGGPSFLAAIAAQEALKDEAHLEANRKNYSDVRKYVCAELERMGITYARDPQAAFIYFRAGIPGRDVSTKMRQANIYIGTSRESGVPEGTYEDWCRVSIGSKEQMDLFLGELAKILGKT